jgi:hypothetical protein
VGGRAAGGRAGELGGAAPREGACARACGVCACACVLEGHALDRTLRTERSLFTPVTRGYSLCMAPPAQKTGNS